MANNAWIWVVAIAAILIFAQTGTFSNLFGEKDVVTDDKVPSTLAVTVTLNTRNALSATGENANVSYYIFDAAGKYIKEGTTSAGTADVSLNVNQKYQILTYGATTYAPKVTEYTVPTGVNSDTVTIDLYPLSDPTINRVQDSLGDTTDANISVGLGYQRSFKVVYSSNNASAQLYKPVVVIDYNTTSTASNGVVISGLNKVDCPTRLSVSTGRTKACFADTSLNTVNSPRELQGSIKFSESVTPASTDNIVVTVIDSMIYANPNYKSVGLSAFVEGTQNANDLSNVGRTDSSTVNLGFAG